MEYANRSGQINKNTRNIVRSKHCSTSEEKRKNSKSFAALPYLKDQQKPGKPPTTEKAHKSTKRPRKEDRSLSHKTSMFFHKSKNSVENSYSMSKPSQVDSRYKKSKNHNKLATLEFGPGGLGANYALKNLTNDSHGEITQKFKQNLHEIVPLLNNIDLSTLKLLILHF